MTIDVFNRYEEKYIIDDQTYRILKKMLSEYMCQDEYSKNDEMYTICNVYYDTWDSDLIRNSIDMLKPAYKEKLRLRSYGTVKETDVAFLEIKKKYEGLVNKRRTSIILSDAYSFLENKTKPETRPFMNEQVINELYYMINRVQLVPKVFLSYDRCALFGRDDQDLRVTFDRNITVRRYDLGLHYGVYGDKLLDEDVWIMEVKIKDAMPMFLTKILSEMNVYPVAFSKYGTEYMKYIQSKAKNEVLGGILC